MLNDKQKIANCVANWGIDENYATKIFKENEDLLTFDELKMKYNNPNLGVEYPDWLTPTEHLKICFQTAKDEYTPTKFGWICEKSELVNMLFIWSSLRLAKFKNHAMLKCACVRACKNILRDNILHAGYIAGSLDADIQNDDTDTRQHNLHNIISSTCNDVEVTNLLNSINSLKNNVIKGLLIVCGYIIAGIDDFEMAFYDYVKTCDCATQDSLLDLLNKVKLYDAATMDRKYNGNKLAKAKRVTVNNVMKILGIQPEFYLTFKNYTKDYLNKRGILN